MRCTKPRTEPAGPSPSETAHVAGRCKPAATAARGVESRASQHRRKKEFGKSGEVFGRDRAGTTNGPTRSLVCGYGEDPRIAALQSTWQWTLLRQAGRLDTQGPLALALEDKPKRVPNLAACHKEWAESGPHAAVSPAELWKEREKELKLEARYRPENQKRNL